MGDNKRLRNSILGVVVPIYNAELFLRECLDSICAQKVPDLRVVLVDDGSTDGSLGICKEYEKKDSRITVIHKENGGPISARRCGVLACDTEYIAFSDADDWMEKEACDMILPYLNEGFDVVSFNHFQVTGTEKKKIHSTIRSGNYSKIELIQEIYPIMIWDMNQGAPGLSTALWDKVFKREHCLRAYELAKDIGFQLGEDSLVLYLIMQWANSFYHVETPLYYHRVWRNEPAAYVSDDRFFDNAYEYYRFLKQNLVDIPGIKRQLEFIYMSLSDARRSLYWKESRRRATSFLFPFDLVPRGSKIIIYGAGTVGKDYMEQLKKLDYCDVVAWIDKNRVEAMGIKTTSIDILKDNSLKYDKIIIAVKNTSLKNEIENELSAIRISSDKIIWSIR